MLDKIIKVFDPLLNFFEKNFIWLVIGGVVFLLLLWLFFIFFGWEIIFNDNQLYETGKNLSKEAGVK